MIVFVEAEPAEPSPEERFERLVELPPSAKLVYVVLTRDGPHTPTQLSEESLLPKRTTREAVKSLKEEDLVREDVYLPDARKKLYHAKEIERPSGKSGSGGSGGVEAD